MRNLKKFLGVLVGIALVGACYAATWTTGTGNTLSATSLLTKLTLSTTVNTLSVYNSGTNAVYSLVNCTTNILATRIAAGTAIVIPASTTYTFDAQGNASIESFCYGVLSGTSVVYTAGY